jgi:hypothetical protein
MHSFMRSALIAAVGSILITLVATNLVPSGSPKWYSEAPASEVADSPIYKVKNIFAGSRYETILYGRDLEGVMKWKDGQELPSGTNSAKLAAEGAFRKQFPEFGQFKIVSMNLVHLTIVDDWIFDVKFNIADFAKIKAGPNEGNEIDIFVLLNGHVISPTVASE